MSFLAQSESISPLLGLNAYFNSTTEFLEIKPNEISDKFSDQYDREVTLTFREG